MANNVKRMISEDGVVLEKIFKKATDAFTASDGRTIGAQPDRYVLKCVSGETFSKDTGFGNPTVLEYKTDKATFDKCVAYSPVNVTYEMSSFGVKAESVSLKN